MQEVTQELDDAKHMVEATLGEQFDDIDFVIVSVQPDVEEWDDELIEIKAIYDGGTGQLRGERMVGVISLLGDAYRSRVSPRSRSCATSRNPTGTSIQVPRSRKKSLTPFLAVSRLETEFWTATPLLTQPRRMDK